MALRIRFHASVEAPPELMPFPARELARLLREEGLADTAGEVQCVLTDDAELAELNRRFRGREGPTDVLTFPYGPGDPDDPDAPAGDVFVSLDRAREQAAERGEPLPREVWRLFVHGALHLAGHEHDTDAGERRMTERQEAWVERRFPAPA